MTIGLAIIWIFPFPIDFVISVLILISINTCRQKELFSGLARMRLVRKAGEDF
jgi:hypothetical protein